jgi:hypothetical protein
VIHRWRRPNSGSTLSESGVAMSFWALLASTRGRRAELAQAPSLTPWWNSVQVRSGVGERKAVEVGTCCHLLPPCGTTGRVTAAATRHSAPQHSTEANILDTASATDDSPAPQTGNPAAALDPPPPTGATTWARHVTVRSPLSAAIQLDKAIQRLPHSGAATARGRRLCRSCHPAHRATRTLMVDL